MINCSKEFYDAMIAGANILTKLEITFKDGTTVNLNGSDILEDGISLDEVVSEESMLSIGNAIVNQLDLKLNNIDHKFDKYNFTDARIKVWFGIDFGTTSEYVDRGYFYVDEANSSKNSVIITALDRLTDFDVPLANAIDLSSYSILVSEALVLVCTYCGVELKEMPVFPTGLNVTINEIPRIETLTCRQLISYVGQLLCKNPSITNDDKLQFSWYDTDFFEQFASYNGGVLDNESETIYVSGDVLNGGTFSFTDGDSADGGDFSQFTDYHSLFKLTDCQLSTDDIIITGIKVTYVPTSSSEEVEPIACMHGIDGYVISIEDNCLITNAVDAQKLADYLYESVAGIKFRPFSCTQVSNVLIEAGDVAVLSDVDGNAYNVLCSSVKTTPLNSQNISCSFKTNKDINSDQYSELFNSVVENRKLKANLIRTNDLLSLVNGLKLNSEKLTDGSNTYTVDDTLVNASSDKQWRATSDGKLQTWNGTTWVAVTDYTEVIGTVLKGSSIKSWNYTVNALGECTNGFKMDFKSNTFDSVNMQIRANGDVFIRGDIYATNGIFNGTIHANSGTIGELEIANGGLYYGVSNNYMEINNYGISFYKQIDNNSRTWMSMVKSMGAIQVGKETNGVTELSQMSPQFVRSNEIWCNTVKCHDLTSWTGNGVSTNEKFSARGLRVDFDGLKEFGFSMYGVASLTRPSGGIQILKDTVPNVVLLDYMLSEESDLFVLSGNAIICKAPASYLVSAQLTESYTGSLSEKKTLCITRNGLVVARCTRRSSNGGSSSLFVDDTFTIAPKYIQCSEYDQLGLTFQDESGNAIIDMSEASTYLTIQKQSYTY